MSRLIRDFAAGTPEMLDAFGDASLIRHALAFEAALAKASGDEGLIDKSAADAIVAACANLKPEVGALAREAAHAGTLAIPLVALLRTQLHDAAAAAAHKGATSQDVADTVLVLQMKDGATLIERDLKRAMVALRSLAQTHAQTSMIGRTLLQQALPITFGLKCAQWLMALRDDAARFQREKDTALALQLGGAVGTRHDFNDKGTSIAKRMADMLGLASGLPWHTRRNHLTAFTNSVALIAATLGKIATDIALMSQPEIGEAAEPAVQGRGGSSAMAHKRNPTGCQVALSASLRTSGLIASLLASAVNEHERGLGGWQADAAIVADVFALTHGALAAMAAVLEGLEVNTEAMRKNLERSGLGLNVGEADALIAAALAESI
jgi:3-carboxy-cis,cis-muconate cycloisomerase